MSAADSIPEISETDLQSEKAAFLKALAADALALDSNADTGAGVGVDVGADADAGGERGMMRFSFSGTPWREVIRWLADQCDLALHVGDLPAGSFTYTDPGTFTPQEAIDRVNLFLLAEGYTLVRSGQLLSVINLGDPRSLQQLDVLAKLIPAERLDEAKPHEVVKVMFALGDIDAEEAVDELAALKLMSSPTVLARTNQLLVTDTVAKLKNVRQVLSAFEPDLMDNGTVVKSFPLRHVLAEDVLEVARPHLGLATGEMIGIDVSLSADVLGKNLFVTGVEDKVKLIENLVAAVDQPEAKLSGEDAEMELRSHLVEGGNVTTVYNVLQTLLAGKTVRLSIDDAAGSIVALASPSVQKEIADTVAQLQASDADFEVIQLQTVDPFFAISLLEQMLDLPDAFTDPDDIDPDTPKIDADPGNRRLFVRAKRYQIDQIKKIVAGLELGGTQAEPTSDNGIRIFPIQGKRAEELLEIAAKFWRSPNPIIVYPGASEPDVDSERVPGQPERQPNRFADGSAAPRFLTTVSNNRTAAIRCQVTDRGLVLQSDDSVALDQFEDHLRALSGPLEQAPVKPVVFYLQHTKPGDAIRMLGELLEGGQAASQGEAGTLVNGFVGSGAPGGFLSSLVTSDQGTTTMMAGTTTVVADSRLNRLIAQGTPEDMELIENYLAIIDKDNSITDIKTYGTSRVIELYNTRASEVAEAIREAYAGRVSSSSGGSSGGSSGRAGGGSSGGGDGREAAAAMARFFAEKGDSDSKKSSAKSPKSSAAPVRDLEPKMTVAVHEPSNSLIVTAPDTLFEQVEKLAREIDSRGEQAVEVVAPMNSEVFGIMLEQMMSGETSTTRRRPNPSSSRNR